MTRRAQLIWWSVAAVAMLALLWLLGGALAPYITAAVLAYLLAPLADWMERAGIGRTLASLLIVGFAVVVLLGMIGAAIPLAIRQAEEFAADLPDYIDRVVAWLEMQAPNLGGNLIGESLAAGEAALREHGVEVAGGLLARTARIVDFFIFIVILPIVTFFLILSWHDMVRAIDELLPRRQAPTIRRILRDMDEVLGGFVRGQFIVALVMAVYYGVALTTVGLSYSIAVGAVAGIGTLIPIIGATVGAVLAIGIALFQFWGEWGQIALVAVVYFGGQLVEGNVITPRLVGPHVKLHPVWLLLALSVFAALFGFIGVLVAVPVAALIGVLVRFGVEQYRGSDLHAGVPEEKPIVDAAGRPVRLDLP